MGHRTWDMGHGTWDIIIIKSSHHAAVKRVELLSLNANLFFEEPHQLAKFAE